MKGVRCRLCAGRTAFEDDGGFGKEAADGAEDCALTASGGAKEYRPWGGEIEGCVEVKGAAAEVRLEAMVSGWTRQARASFCRGRRRIAAQ